MVDNLYADDGVHWDKRRKSVLERDNYTCQNRHCGYTSGNGVGLRAHHIHLDECGGSDDKENLVTLCKSCHNALHRYGEGDVRPVSVLEEINYPLSDSSERGMAQVMEDEYEPTGDDASVLEIIRDEGRANPYLIRQRTDLGKGDVNTILVRLAQYGYIQKVTRGLYEYNESGRDCRDTILRARRGIEDVLDAMDRNDGQAARRAAADVRDVLNEVDV